MFSARARTDRLRVRVRIRAPPAPAWLRALQVVQVRVQGLASRKHEGTHPKPGEYEYGSR
eukprot:scaffold132173_cov18-Prasinocladus_malaysianus.AAC.3